MLASVLRSSNVIAGYILSGIFAAIVVFLAYNHNLPLVQTQSGIAFTLFLNIPLWLQGILSWIALMLQGILLNEIFNDNRFFETKNSWFTFSFISICALNPNWFVKSPVIFAMLFLSWALYDLFQSYHRKNQSSYFFNIGIKAAIASLIYQPAYIVPILMLTGFFIVGETKLRSILLFFFGILVPYYFVWAFYFLTDSFALFIPQLIWYKEQTPSIGKIEWYELLVGINLLFVLVIGLMNMPAALKRSKVQARIYVQMFLVLLIEVVLLSIFLPSNKWLIIAFCVPFLVMFQGKGLNTLKSRAIAEIVVLQIIGLSLYSYWN